MEVVILALFYSLNYLHFANLDTSCCCSVAQLCPALQPRGLQHARLPCPSLVPRVCLNSCPFYQ